MANPHSQETPLSDELNDDGDSNTAALLPKSPRESQRNPSSLSTAQYSTTTDAHPWPVTAYEMITAWTSAGESTMALETEEEHDHDLFHKFPPSKQRSGHQPSQRTDVSPNDQRQRTFEESIINYFENWTASIFGTLVGIIESEAAPPGSHEGEEVRIYVSKDDLAQMGLDIWSDRDKQFVRDLAQVYLGIEADVEGGVVECCGVRIY